VKFSDRILGALFRDRGLDPVWAARSPSPQSSEYVRPSGADGSFGALSGRILKGPEARCGIEGEPEGYEVVLPGGGAPEILHDIPASELRWGVPAGNWREEGSCLPSEREMAKRFRRG
jgi:hypothetical protein